MLVDDSEMEPALHAAFGEDAVTACNSSNGDIEVTAQFCSGVGSQLEE